MASMPQCLPQRQLCQRRQLAHSGDWHTLVTLALGPGLELGTLPPSQEKRAGQLAGDAWCLLTSAGHCCWAGVTTQSGAALLLLLSCWLQTGTRGICPGDVQDCEMQLLREKKNQPNTHSNAPKKCKKKPQKRSLHLHCLSSMAKAKRQERVKRQESSAWVTDFYKGLVLPCPVVLFPAAGSERDSDSYGHRQIQNTITVWATQDIDKSRS